MLDGDILCYIVAFGNDEKSRQWMKDNYEKARFYFLESHLRSRTMNHGIKKVENPSYNKYFEYHWEVHCDCNDTEHAKQTGWNLKGAIERLEGPSEGIGLLFLRYKANGKRQKYGVDIEGYLIKQEQFDPIELERVY
jgi:hypothetical protein